MVSLDPSPEQIWDAGGSLFLALKAACSTTPTLRLESCRGDPITTVPLAAVRSLMWETLVLTGSKSAGNRKRMTGGSQRSQGGAAPRKTSKISDEKWFFPEGSRLSSMGTEVCKTMSGLERGTNCDYSLSLPEQEPWTIK